MTGSRGWTVITVAVVVIAALWWSTSDSPGPDLPAYELRRGNGPEPESLDIHQARGNSALHILRDLYEGLTTHAPDGSVVPGVASRWDVSEDGRRWTFHLRPDARWSNGDGVTAGNFVSAWRRLVDPATAAPYALMIDGVANARAIVAGDASPDTLGVDAPDPHTLVVRLDSPVPYLPSLLTHPATFPIHRADGGVNAEKLAELVSNGAYRGVEWRVGSHVLLQRNPHFRENAATTIDTVRFLHFDDETAELQQFRADQVDITYTIPQARYEWVREKLGDRLHVATTLATYYYGFNVTRPPLDDTRVRRALSLAVDRRLLTEKITGVGEQPACSFVPDGVANYVPQTFDYCDAPMPERLAEARALLADAGYSDENPLSVEIRYNHGEIHDRLAVAIASMWREGLGVESTLVNVEFRVLLDQLRERQVTEVFRTSWFGDYDDAYTFTSILTTESPFNSSGWSNEQYDELARRAAASNDPVARQALLEEAERLALSEHAVMPLYFYVSKHLVHPRVQGFRDNVLNVYYSRHLALRSE